MTKAAHPNVLTAIKDFKGYLSELPKATVSRSEEIRTQAVACYDLMNYSYEVADTGHSAWKELDRLVGQVMVACRGARP